MAKISIIIPVYNSEKYIRRCLNSILNQTFQDFEIILIDDNSKENSLKIISEIEKIHKDKIKILKNAKNVGAGASRNKGLKIASGEYITFIDSDDYIEKNTLKRMHESCVNTDSDIARINMKKVSFFIHWTYIKKRKYIFELELRKHLKYCNRVIEIYSIKRFHFYFPKDFIFRQDYLYIRPIVYNNKKELGLVGIKNRLL